MPNLCPKRMKWHLRDSRYKISQGRMPLDTLRGLAPSAIKCPFQDSAPAAFQTFRRPCDEFPYFFINCGPAGDTVLTTNRQTEKSYFNTNYITTFILHKLSCENTQNFWVACDQPIVTSPHQFLKRKTIMTFGLLQLAPPFFEKNPAFKHG